MAIRNKVRFNIIDFLLIVLILLSVAALVFRPMVLEKLSKFAANDTVVVSFYADRLTENEYSVLKQGDQFTVNEDRFGELLSFSVQPYKTLQLMESDVESEHPFFSEVAEPGLYTVKGQIRLTGVSREDGFYVAGDLQVGVGSIVEVKSNSYVLTLQITGIS